MEWQAEVDWCSPGLGGWLRREWLQTRTKAARVYLSRCYQPRSRRPRQLDLRSGRLARRKPDEGRRWRGEMEKEEEGMGGVESCRRMIDFEVGGSSW
jgi:hypothetical protein